jgi:hypothetical protein
MLGAEDEYAEDFRALCGLGEAFTELIAAFGSRVHHEVTTERVVRLAATWMPRGQFVAVLSHVDGGVRTVAGSDPRVCVIDRIRDETAQGPALDVVEGNDLVVSDNLAADLRWPAFGPRVADEAGILSLVAYRLVLGRPGPAVLTFYSDWAQAFDPLAIATGALFAAYASLALAGQPQTRPAPEAAERAPSGHVEKACSARATADRSAVRGRRLVLEGLRRAARGMDRAADARDRAAHSKETMAAFRCS